MTASTPAAVVCQASLPTQKVVEGTLETLPNLVQLASLKPPSLIVVGQCVTQRSQLNWFERLPLFGLSIGSRGQKIRPTTSPAKSYGSAVNPC